MDYLGLWWISKNLAPNGAFKERIMKFKLSPKNLVIYLKEVKTEAKKVNWPTRKETMKYTLVVIAIAMAVAIFLGALDFIFTLILKKFFL